MGSDGSPPTITLHTNLDAPRYRVVRGDMSAAAAGNFAASCSDLLPQHDKDLLQWASLIKGGTLLACYLRDVVTALQLHSWDSGSLIKPVAMPGIGSVGGFSGNHKSTGVGMDAVGCGGVRATVVVDVALCLSKDVCWLYHHLHLAPSCRRLPPPLQSASSHSPPSLSR
jgi:hypothetical protein